MVVSAVFIIDLKGKVLISRNYRGDVTRVQAERFAQKVQETDPTELKPVFVDAGVTYMYLQVRWSRVQAMWGPGVGSAIGFEVPLTEGALCRRLQHNNVYVLALTRRNSNVTAVFVFLEKLVEVMREYFGQLEEVGGTAGRRSSAHEDCAVPRVQESIRDNFVLIYELLDEIMVG